MRSMRITNLRPRARGWAKSRGQVLLVAVLILFGIATLSALFVGILGTHMARVMRTSDVSDLRAIAEGGLAQANHALLYSVNGADWRPDTRPVQVGRGQCQLRVSYGPTPGDLQSRYLLVSATATFPDDPFSSYTILGVKPLMLTDYARCITDLHELRQAATLGVSGVEGDGLPRDDYKFLVRGPIFSNTDLVWYGPSIVNLYTSASAVPLTGGKTLADFGVLRDDRIEVAGSMHTPRDGNGGFLDLANPVSLNVNDITYAGNVFTSGGLPGFPDMTSNSPVANSWRVLADTTQFGGYSVPRIRPPRMDAVEPDLNTNRYYTLTRDSGPWVLDTINNSPTYNTLVDPGQWGWGWAYGGGIYLDNTSDIQYPISGGHDLDNLRQNWVQGAAGSGKDGRTAGNTADWWDQSGRYYAPPGAEIILHGEAACPYIEIIRDDLQTYTDTNKVSTKYYWKRPVTDSNGHTVGEAPIDPGQTYPYAPPLPTMCHPSANGHPTIGITGNRAVFPFPPNGVLYAEGNVRVRGVMPPTRNATANMPYLPHPNPSNLNDFSSAGTSSWARKYDLQIVSGGTIYIEGDILSPVSAKLYPSNLENDPVGKMNWDQLCGSRVALIAHDSVCLNTTALNPRPANLTVKDAGGNLFNDGQTLYPDVSKNVVPSDMLFHGPTDATTNLDTSAAPGPLPDGGYPTTPANIDFVYDNVRLATAWYLAGVSPNPALLNDLRSMNLNLLMGHSAWYTSGNAAPPPITGVITPDGTTVPFQAAEAKVRVSVVLASALMSSQEWPWPGSNPYYEFQTATPTNQDTYHHWYLENQWYNDPTKSPFEQDSSNNYKNDFLGWSALPAADTNKNLYLSGQDRITITPSVYPVWEHGNPTDTSTWSWIVHPSELGYVLGPMAVTPPRGSLPMPVRIDALVYAETGSWFVLPGPWFNENPADLDPNKVGAANVLADIQKNPQNYPAAPIYHEPLNMQIWVCGAITENMPALPGDVANWTSKWAGQLTAPTQPLTQSWQGLVYEYDPMLRQARWETTGQCARFPNLPLSPDLLIWGERVAGFGGAGI